MANRMSRMIGSLARVAGKGLKGIREKDHAIRSLLERGIDTVADKADSLRPRLNDLRVVPKAKALRAVNKTAFKAVDTLERAGMLSSRQAQRARVGIASADSFDVSMPDTAHTRIDTFTNRKPSRYKWEYDDKSKSMKPTRNRGMLASRVVYDAPPDRPIDAEKRRYYEETVHPRKIDVYEGLSPKGKKEMEELMGSTLMRRGNLPLMHRGYSTYSPLGTADRAYDRRNKKIDAFNEKFPDPMSTRSKKGKWQETMRRGAIAMGHYPSDKLLNRARLAEENAVMAYRHAYQDLRRLAGLGAGLGAAAIGAGAVANSRKKDTKKRLGSKYY